jgi:hypothetical protein
MINKIKKYIISPRTILRVYNLERMTSYKKSFIKELRKFKYNDLNKVEANILLIQRVRDYHFTIKLGAASNIIASKYNLKVLNYDVDIFWNTKDQILQSIFSFFGINGIEKIYRQFSEKSSYKNSQIYSNQKFINKKLDEIKNTLNDVDSLLILKIDDIFVGDLIYDTYLRFYNKPTLENINNDVYVIIEKALNIFYNFSDYLNKNNIKCLLTTYVSYIYHGIITRICLKNGITVFTLGYNNYFLQKISLDFPYHHINHTKFSNKYDVSAENLRLAKDTFESRFTGKIDIATSYMRKSAYNVDLMPSDLIKLFLTKSRNIVIYSHDFFDSPHINRNILFPDFYQFLKNALNAVENIKGVNVFIKVHPNGISGCKEILINLVKSFNKDYFYIIDDTVSNLTIIQLKPDLVCTARGTIGAEMAYHEIPTIALFDNIYANFDFVHTCYDTEEYFSIMRGEKKAKVNFDKDNIYKFYYLSYLKNTFNNSKIIFSLLHQFKGEVYSDDYLEYLEKINYKMYTQDLLISYRNALENEISIC